MPSKNLVETKITLTDNLRELESVAEKVRDMLKRLGRIEEAYGESASGITADHMRTPVRVIEGIGEQLAEIAADIKQTAATAKASF